MAADSRMTVSSRSGESAVAALVMTVSGVLSAWARLPACRRASSACSSLCASSWLISSVSGRISVGNSWLIRVSWPERIDATGQGQAVGVARQQAAHEQPLVAADIHQQALRLAQGDEVDGRQVIQLVDDRRVQQVHEPGDPGCVLGIDTPADYERWIAGVSP